VSAPKLDPATLPIRIMVFPTKPNAIVLFADDGAEVDLPVLDAPFTKAGVHKAFEGYGVEYRITEGAPGRYTPAVAELLSAEKAERQQRANLDVAKTVARLDASGSATDKERAGLIAEKHDVDTERQEVRAKLREATKQAAIRGKYMDREKFGRLQERMQKLGMRSQAIQVRLTELKAQHRSSVVDKELEEFKSLVKDLIGDEQYAELWVIARENVADGRE